MNSTYINFLPTILQESKEFLKSIKQRFKARIYKYLIIISFKISPKILKKYISANIKLKKHSYPLVWLLNFERSQAEVDFFLKRNFNLLLIDNLFLKELLLFFGKDLDHQIKIKKFNPETRFFLDVLENINLKLIISPALHYNINYFGYLVKSSKVRFVIYHRENYNFSKDHIKNINIFFKKNKSRWKMVDLFVFHNNFYKNLFSKGSSELKKKAKVVGPLRFDTMKYLKKNVSSKIKKELLFLAIHHSFPAWVQSNKYNKFENKPNPFGNISYYIRNNKIKYKHENKIYFYDAFIKSNLIFIKNAIRFPNYEFEIKIKWKDYRWIKIINQIIKKEVGEYPINLFIL